MKKKVPGGVTWSQAFTLQPGWLLQTKRSEGRGGLLPDTLKPQPCSSFPGDSELWL